MIFIGILLSIATIGLACYALTSGVEHGWTALVTIACAVGAVLAATAFVIHENRTTAPMLDLRLFRDGTVRGLPSPRSAPRSRWPR